MKYLNLSEGFNPYNSMPGEEIAFNSFIFSGGEPHIKIISSFNEKVDITITTRLSTSDDFIMLLLATDVLYQSGWCGNVDLFIPYFPGARQDRRMTSGEPLTVDIYTDIINDRRYDSVDIFDPHSEVVVALLRNVSVINNHKFVRKALAEITRVDASNPLEFNMWGKEFWLVSPDAGSNKKIIPLAISLGAESIVKCDKVRDVLTGKLSGFEVYADDLKGRDAIIVDDICDGGNTFLGLAKELKAKNAGELHLVVSHGIFSKGVEKLLKVFKSIWTTDSIKSSEEIAEYVYNFNVIKLANVI